VTATGESSKRHPAGRATPVVERTASRGELHRARKSFAPPEISPRRGYVDCDSIARLQVKNRVRDTGQQAAEVTYAADVHCALRNNDEWNHPRHWPKARCSNFVKAKREIEMWRIVGVELWRTIRNNVSACCTERVSTAPRLKSAAVAENRCAVRAEIADPVLLLTLAAHQLSSREEDIDDVQDGGQDGGHAAERY
jgi:hypothetical protein